MESEEEGIPWESRRLVQSGAHESKWEGRDRSVAGVLNGLVIKGAGGEARMFGRGGKLC